MLAHPDAQHQPKKQVSQHVWVFYCVCVEAQGIAQVCQHFVYCLNVGRCITPMVGHTGTCKCQESSVVKPVVAFEGVVYVNCEKEACDV